MKRLRFLLVVAGILLTVLGLHELLVARVWKAEPQEITCADLAIRGPGSNAHVRLLAFALAERPGLHEDDPEGGWKRVWIPAFPETEMGTPAHDPTAFRVLVRTDRVGTPADRDRLAEQASIDGLVINEIDSLASHEVQRLEDAYPHTQIDRCWVLDHERKPMSTIAAEVLLLGGLLLLGLGFWLFVWGRKRRAVIPDAVLPPSRS